LHRRVVWRFAAGTGCFRHGGVGHFFKVGNEDIRGWSTSGRDGIGVDVSVDVGDGVVHCWMALSRYCWPIELAKEASSVKSVDCLRIFYA
jgi:hypothetical protein